MTLVAGRMPGIHSLERNHYGEEVGMPGILKSGTSQRPSREAKPFIRQAEHQRNEDGRRLVRFCESENDEVNDKSERESVNEDETQDVIMFGSNMYYINKSDPNSAVRKLFPNSKLTPINPFINRINNRENSSNTPHPSKMLENSRNLFNRSKLSENENKNNQARRKVVEQSNQRRNIQKLTTENKQKLGKTNESSTPLIERIKQLTCESEETQENKNEKDIPRNGSQTRKNDSENCSKFSKNRLQSSYPAHDPKDLPKQAKEGLNLLRYNQCISQTRSQEHSENKFYTQSKTSPTEEARRSFLSSLSQPTEDKPGDRNSVCSNSTAGDTVYSLSDIEEALSDEEKEIKEAFAHENRQDELELFVQQDAGRTERLKKRYSATPKPEKQISGFTNPRPSHLTNSSTNLINYANESNTLKKERPKFGSTIEILQQLQQQIETPYQLEGRRTACSNYSDSSIPISERLFCDESSDGYEPVLAKQNVHRTCSLDSKNYEEIDNFPSAFSVPRTKSHEHPRLSQMGSDPYFHPPLSPRYPGYSGRGQMFEHSVYASSPDLHGYHRPVIPDRVSSYTSHTSRQRQLHPVLQRQYCRYPVNEVSPRPADEGKILTPPIRMHTYMNVPVNSPAYPPPPPYSKINPHPAPPHMDFYPYQTPIHSNIYQNIPVPTHPSVMSLHRLCTERERGVPEGASSSYDSDEMFPHCDAYYPPSMTTIPKPSSEPYHYCVDV